MKKPVFMRARLFAAAIMLFVATIVAVPAHAATSTGVSLNTHTMMVDASGKLVSWVDTQDQAYSAVSKLAWDYITTKVPNDPDTGKPAYLSRSYINPNTQEMVGWPHNPAGTYAMLIESAMEYYQYSGDAKVLTVAKNVADQQLTTGMTKATDNWANVPYASGNAGSLTYGGASYGDGNGAGDGTGVIQPDKVGEFGVGLIELYKQTGEQKYLTAAINSADALASHVRTGTASQSPWPYRVFASNNTVREQYSSHVIAPIELLDQLIALNAGNVSSYQTARTTAWNWMMTYPMQNNVWTQYFEDVEIQSNYSTNLNQLNAMMTARYLLEHPEMDANWEAHVRGLISWVEQNFSGTQYGANQIREQKVFDYRMGSHTARYAAVNALLYEKTGDAAAKEKAYRSFNWATYMARSTGVVIDGPEVNNEWFTDGYGDYIRHFMVGMGAVPEWAPAGQTHLIESSSIVQAITYTANGVSYRTFDTSATEEIKVDRVPTSITANGVALSQRTDSNAEGWVYDANTSTIKVKHTSGANVVVTLSGTPANQAPSVTITAPTNGSTVVAPAAFTITADASDPEGALQKVEFYQNGTLISTDTTSPYSASVQGLGSGSYSFTAKAYDTASAATTSSAVAVTVSSGNNASWTNSDIGSVGVTGSSSYANGVFTVKGSGTDIWDAADSFNYHYVQMTGDGEIKARVASQQNTDPWALAGVMIRENLTAGSRHALAAITPSNGLSFDYRGAASGSTSYVNGGTGAAPYWLRLVRSGNTFTGYKSTNGTTWTSMGSTTLALGTTVYAGMAVTSHNNSTLGTATFDNVFVTGQNTGADTTAPVISAVAAGAFNVNGGSVGWTTNEPSTSQVEYGKTTSYGTSTAVNTTLDTSHTQVVSGLDPSSTYHYRVKSTDAAGNTAISGDYTFVTQSPADTTAPTVPTNVSASATNATTAAISWTASTDAIGVTGYTIYRNGVSVGTSTGTSFTNTGLASATTYSYTVAASDAAGNLSAQSSAASVTTPTNADTTAPTVSITAPTNSSTVSGTNVAITASASDNVGVSGVQFKLNGANLGTEDTSSPYSTSWNTTAVANGTYTLSAIARDAAGNTTTSSTVTVTVNNVAAQSGLIAAYNFNQGSGTSLSDQGTGTHVGTINGATWSTAGKNGNALSFNGTSNTVSIADANDLDLTNVTVEAWIKPTNVTGWRTLLMKEGNSNTISYGLYAANNVKRAAFYGDFAGNDIGVNGTANISTTAWTHITGSYDGSTLRLYTNGALTASKAQAGPLVTSNGKLSIGGNSFWGEYYAGLMDDIRIYNRVLTVSEIQTDMNAPV